MPSRLVDVVLVVSDSKNKHEWNHGLFSLSKVGYNYSC